MEAILELVIAGAKKLFDLIPVWMNASAEKKKEIEERARTLVNGLDATFDKADARDDANTKSTEEALK